MKNRLWSLLLAFLFLVIASSMSHAAIVEGTYNSADFYITIQSLPDGTFGLGDIASGYSADGFSTVTGNIRTVDNNQIAWVWTDASGLSGYWTTYTEREGGTITTNGAAFGESGIYTGSISTYTEGRTYYSRVDTSASWTFAGCSGTATASFTYDQAPGFIFSSTRQYEFTLADYSGPDTDGFRYINFPQTDGVLTISSVPIPSAITLLGFGLLGLAGVSRPKK